MQPTLTKQLFWKFLHEHEQNILFNFQGWFWCRKKLFEFCACGVCVHCSPSMRWGKQSKEKFFLILYVFERVPNRSVSTSSSVSLSPNERETVVWSGQRVVRLVVMFLTCQSILLLWIISLLFLNFLFLRKFLWREEGCDD